MSVPQEKRIVSKGEYAKAKAKRESLRLMGVCLLLGSEILGFISVFLLCSGIGLLACFIGMCVGIIAFCLGKWGFESIQKSHTIEPGLLFTLANTADLPAPDTLVRASQEPAQTQEAILLRSATEGRKEEDGEHLLRAVSK